jgi:hypothetical protein
MVRNSVTESVGHPGVDELDGGGGMIIDDEEDGALYDDEGFEWLYDGDDE